MIGNRGVVCLGEAPGKIGGASDRHLLAHLQAIFSGGMHRVRSLATTISRQEAVVDSKGH